MSQEKFLIDEERMNVRTYKEVDKSNRRIAALSRSGKTIRTFLKMGEQYGVWRFTRGNTKVAFREKAQKKAEATTSRLPKL